MSKREMLVALGSRCRGSRLKTFQNIYRQEFKSGAVGTDPDAVYEKIKNKHLLFSESVEEREINHLDTGLQSPIFFGTRCSDEGKADGPPVQASL